MKKIRKVQGKAKFHQKFSATGWTAWHTAEKGELILLAFIIAEEVRSCIAQQLDSQGNDSLDFCFY